MWVEAGKLLNCEINIYPIELSYFGITLSVTCG